MTEPKRERMSATKFRETWERAQMDLKLLMERAIETQHQVHELIGIHADIYEGILAEEAPEFAFEAKVVRSA